MKKLMIMVLTAVMSWTAQAQQMPDFPMDKAVRYGKLNNGLTYYIRHNEEPKDRANFYIVQKVGSVQEDDSQQGLAHFLEHMCFNGTRHFPGNTLTEYCEKIGVKFGYNLNAYTWFDETVYNINDVPTTSKNNVDSCLLILSDWADGLLLETAEIDKERGVINEEWRLRIGAVQRMVERNLQSIFPGSKYGERNPMGKMDIIKSFKPEVLRAYYEKWYRPDLQAVVIVGDIDTDYVEGKIEQLFGDIKMPDNPAKFELYPLADNNEPIYAIDKDKEMTMNQLMVAFRSDIMPFEQRGGVQFMVQNYMADVISRCLGNRLTEIARKGDCPYLQTFVKYGKYQNIKASDALNISILPKQGRDAKALQAVMQEVERARRYGFTATEVLRARDESVSQLEQTYDNRAKLKNAYYVDKYVRHFLEGNYITDIETEFQTYKMLSQQLPVEAVSEVFKQMTASTDKNFICVGLYSDKEGVSIPTTDELHSAVDAARNAQLEAYVDDVKDEPLVTEMPAPVEIKSEKSADYGYTCWTLANGARVFYKPTDFNASQVRMSALSFGGENKLDKKDISNAELLPIIMQSTGLGSFSSTELQKKLAGKQVKLFPVLTQEQDRMDGECTPKELRTLFELIYLRFQAPAVDNNGYNNVIESLKAAQQNIAKNPNVAFMDSVQQTLYAHNERIGSIIPDVEHADYETIRRIYSERFASAGDFDFFFTGAIDVDSLWAFTEQYIAPMKGVEQREELTDLGIRPAKGTVENRFVRELESPQANIQQIWTGEAAFTPKNTAVINTLSEILRQRFLKTIREEKSYAYHVTVDSELDCIPYDKYSFKIECPVKPEKMDSALYLIRAGIEDIAANGVTADELAKVKEFSVKHYNDRQRENGYWQEMIINRVVWDKEQHDGMLEAIRTVTSDDVRDFVNNTLLKQNNCVTVTMLPAGK